ncbi:hypothetical protein BHE74_00027405 [Ensete ventricosum]|nr:hypothetical protein BHE74_00027405 [Ensete ventricosum]RZR80134.1 hypothetical protein BHM03_00006062 [Ensete ventricosum]
MFFLQLGLGAKRKAGFNGDKNPPRRKTKTQMHGMNRKMALSLVVIGEWSQCEERAKGSLSAGSRGFRKNPTTAGRAEHAAAARHSQRRMRRFSRTLFARFLAFRWSARPAF